MGKYKVSKIVGYTDHEIYQSPIHTPFIPILIAGCAKPSLPEIGAFIEVYGSPHIVQDDVCYYVGFWQPGAVVLKIKYKKATPPIKLTLPGSYYIEGATLTINRLSQLSQNI